MVIFYLTFWGRIIASILWWPPRFSAATRRWYSAIPALMNSMFLAVGQWRKRACALWQPRYERALAYFIWKYERPQLIGRAHYWEGGIINDPTESRRAFWSILTSTRNWIRCKRKHTNTLSHQWRVVVRGLGKNVKIEGISDLMDKL